MGSPEDRKKALKDLIKRLHEGADPQEMKNRFEEIVGRTSAEELAKIEEEMIKEGMAREEIHRLCDVHLAVFKEALEKDKSIAPPGHPVHILMKEHALLLEYAAHLRDLTGGAPAKSLATVCGCAACSAFEAGSGGAAPGSGPSPQEKAMEQLRHVVTHLKASENHYVREENVLFPYLEKHGVTEPPAIMWMEHNKIRGIKKQLYEALEAGATLADPQGRKQLKDIAIGLLETTSSHFYKENNILFPTAMKVITNQEWPEIRRQFDDIGYCCFTPEAATVPLGGTGAAAGAPGAAAGASAPAQAGGAGAAAGAAPAARGIVEDAIVLETGNIPRESLEALLNTIPAELTFVDADDTVRFYSVPKDPIFPRTKAIIGRKVQLCHPQSSVHVVDKLVTEMKSGKRDVAEFWMQRGENTIHIRYFAVRDKARRYVGCLEVTQDVTGIKKLTGEKRLMD
jgi:DUF438 domain-containing protein